jgi:hypothetical protein
MKIPASFKIFGQDVTVRFVDRLSDGEGLLGRIDYNTNTITLQRENDGTALARRRVEQVFLHEVVHCALNALGEFELRKNEKLVETLSQCFHQYLLTQEGEAS